MKSGILNTDFRRVHNDSWHKVEEDVVAVCADTCVAEGHLQLIHGLQKKTFSLILKVLKGGFLVAYKENVISNSIATNAIIIFSKAKTLITLAKHCWILSSTLTTDLCNEIWVSNNGPYEEAVVCDFNPLLHTRCTKVKVHLVVFAGNSCQVKVLHAV